MAAGKRHLRNAGSNIYKGLDAAVDLLAFNAGVAGGLYLGNEFFFQPWCWEMVDDVVNSIPGGNAGSKIAGYSILAAGYGAAHVAKKKFRMPKLVKKTMPRKIQQFFTKSDRQRKLSYAKTALFTGLLLCAGYSANVAHDAKRVYRQIKSTTLQIEKVTDIADYAKIPFESRNLQTLKDHLSGRRIAGAVLDLEDLVGGGPPRHLLGPLDSTRVKSEIFRVRHLQGHEKDTQIAEDARRLEGAGIENPEQLIYLARALYDEGFSEGKEGMKRIMHVIINRREYELRRKSGIFSPQKKPSLYDILMDNKTRWSQRRGLIPIPGHTEWQFTCVRDRSRHYSEAHDEKGDLKLGSSRGINTAYAAAVEAISERLAGARDPTNRSHYYVNEGIVGVPGWAKSNKIVKTGKYKRHTFYKRR